MLTQKKRSFKSQKAKNRNATIAVFLCLNTHAGPTEASAAPPTRDRALLTHQLFPRIRTILQISIFHSILITSKTGFPPQ